MKLDETPLLNLKKLHIGRSVLALLCAIVPTLACANQQNFPVYFAHSGDRTWFAESGISSQIAQVKELNNDGTPPTVVLSGLMLPAGVFMNPITDMGYENGVVWIAHREVDANGNVWDAVSAFDPDDPVSTFTTIATAPAAPEPVEDVSPGEDPDRTIIVGATQGFIVLMPGNLRGAPVPNEPPAEVDVDLVFPGEDPRRTAAGGASIDDLGDLVTLPGEFQRPAPTQPPEPVTEVTPGEDPRRTEGGGAEAPSTIVTIPGSGTVPAPTPVTIITPGEDPERSDGMATASAASAKQEKRKSLILFNTKKLKN